MIEEISEKQKPEGWPANAIREYSISSKKI